MEKILYVANSRRIDGDSFDLCVTFDVKQATAAAVEDWHHMTDAERHTSINAVSGYIVHVITGETAKQAYDRMMDNDTFPSDPNYYEALSPLDA